MCLIYTEKHVENALHISKDRGRTVTCLVIHEFGILQAKEWCPTSHDEDTILQPSRDDVILLPQHQLLRDYTPLIETFEASLQNMD